MLNKRGERGTCLIIFYAALPCYNAHLSIAWVEKKGPYGAYT